MMPLFILGIFGNFPLPKKFTDPLATVGPTSKGREERRRKGESGDRKGTPPKSKSVG